MFCYVYLKKSLIFFIFHRTKRMVVDVIRCQTHGDNLITVLNTPATDAEVGLISSVISQSDTDTEG